MKWRKAVEDGTAHDLALQFDAPTQPSLESPRAMKKHLSHIVDRVYKQDRTFGERGG